MWHHFITLPPVARVVALLGVVGVACYGWLKRKAIGTVSGAATSAASERFWGYVRRKLKTDAKTDTSEPTYERTYRGIFRGYSQSANPPSDRFFTLVNDGTIFKVPVMRTNLLSGIQHGEFVEIDTRVGVNYYAEVVQRVRVRDSTTK